MQTVNLHFPATCDFLLLYVYTSQYLSFKACSCICHRSPGKAVTGPPLLQVRRFGAGAEGNILYVFQVSSYIDKHANRNIRAT